jgi:hypothetical protein
MIDRVTVADPDPDLVTVGTNLALLLATRGEKSRARSRLNVSAIDLARDQWTDASLSRRLTATTRAVRPTLRLTIKSLGP